MEIIKASGNRMVQSKWIFTPLDISCMNMVIKGTWLFSSHPQPQILQNSLSELLRYYPHVAGRICNGKYIEINNTGVSFTFSEEPGITTKDVLSDSKAIDRYAAPIDLKKAKKGESPLFTVKLTHLKDGSILSVHCAHVCMDGSSFYTMMQNWGKLARKEIVEPPVLDQSLFPVTDKSVTKEQVTEKVMERKWKSVNFSFIIDHIISGIKGINHHRTGAIKLSNKDIAQLKQKIEDETGKTFGTHAVLCAWITKMCLELFKIEKDKTCSVISVVDARGRAGNIPENFIGNAVSNIPSAGFPAGANISVFAEAVANSLKILQEPQQFEEFILLNLYAMEYTLPFVPFDVKAMNSKHPTVIYINNFSRFPMYDIDFGTGRPFRILPHDLPDAVKVFPSPNGEGVEIYLAGYLAKYYNKVLSKPLKL